SGTLTFADGETRKSVAVTLIDDNTPEEQEAFGFAIDNVQGGASLGAPRTAQITIADDDGFTYNGNQYVVTNGAKTWQAAQAEAIALGGNLVSINTAAEEAWLKQTFGANEGFWIGINDATQEGQFRWASGDPVGYTNWAPGEPNDGGATGSQDYGWMNFGTTKQWDDNSAGSTLRGIIEIGDFNGPSGGQGNGLKGEYYNNTNFTDLAVTRTDATVDFNWGNGSPAANIGADTFSARWTGKVEPLYSERYTFQTRTDDGVRLWVNNQLIIDSFVNQQPTNRTGSITLNAGQQYDIRMEYFEGAGGALAELSWSSASQPLEIVPRSQLYSDPVDSRTLTRQNVLSGLNFPTSVDWLTDGSERMLVAEQGGVVKLYENGSLRNTPFIDISNQVNGVRDRGLLDIAVHPNFTNNPYVYLLFTYDPPEVNNNSGAAGPDGTNNRAARLIRVTADASNNYRTAVPGSEVVLLGKNSTWDNYNGFANSTFNFSEAPAGILPDGSNLQDFLAADSESHTIGSVEFGPDGALYVSNGDGTSYNRVDPRTTRVQDIDNLSGKVLRINPITGKGLSDNPFFNGDADANRSKVYQLGLRNPFRMSVDPDSGKVYIGDVGWTQWEEINAGGPGANFGWPYFEGGSGESLRTGGYDALPEAQAFYNTGQQTVPSLYALNHSADGINAIVMGDVYTGDAYPDRYQGDVFFGDLGQGIIRTLSLDNSGNVTSVDTFDTVEPYVVQIQEGPDGQLYYVNQLDGTVKRWTFT
ncbi:MAG: PQQ-dependent sugar dehydrogenase, partial [Cyanobacteria bacterium J06649_4]